MVLEEQPDKKIAVIDSRSAGSELVLLVKKICELIESGAEFETVVEKAELYSRHTHVSSLSRRSTISSRTAA